MPLDLLAVDHIQICVPPGAEAAARRFYGEILGLREIPKPNKNRGGAWYQHGAVQIHLSIEDSAIDNQRSRRHVCYRVADLTHAEAELRRAGIAILPDDRPIPGWRRFYVQDPGGNRIEIAQADEGGSAG